MHKSLSLIPITLNSKLVNCGDVGILCGMYKLERVGGRSTLAFAGAPIIADHSGAHVAGGFPDTFLEESPVPPAHPPGRMMSLDAKPTMDSLYSQDAQDPAGFLRAVSCRSGKGYGHTTRKPASVPPPSEHPPSDQEDASKSLAASPTRASFDHGRQRKEPAVRDGYWWKTIC